MFKIEMKTVSDVLRIVLDLNVREGRSNRMGDDIAEKCGFQGW